jgi:N6-adenosine-specific RNA methylase IME4
MTDLALPDPATIAVAEVRSRLVPMAQAWRERAREQQDIGLVQDLRARLDAFARLMRDRQGRDLVQAEVRRCEVLVGELLGPAPEPGTEVGRGRASVSHAGEANLPRQDRVRFRTLAANAGRVEELLTAGVTTRRAILDKLRVPERSADGQPTIPTGKVRVIVADPPWRYGNAGTRANAEGHYDGTMTVPDICALDVQVKEWTDDDAHLYLWTTAGFLRDAFDVMEAWGFEYKTFLAWVKPQMGMGNYFRVSSELVLFGVKGRLPIEDRGIKNWFEARRGRHSAKPQTFYDLVQRASPGPYLEMFSRCYAADSLPGTCHCTKCARGWQVWGNEA